MPELPDSLSALPDDARTWVFTADRALTPPESERLLDAVGAFVRDWASHGRPVPGGTAFLHGRFLLIAAHLGEGQNAGVSGCGIDSMTQALGAIASDLGVQWLDALHVAFREADGAVAVVPRPAFRQLARSGAVTAETPVFDTTVERLGDLRAQGLERPAGASWHGRVFRLAPAEASPA